MVQPVYHGIGYGGQLLLEIEQLFPELRYELFTSSKSHRNLSIYEHLGYVRFKEIALTSELILIYLEKNTSL